MVKICIGNQVKNERVCTKVPEGVGMNATFVVKFSADVQECDITTDANVYQKHSCPIEKVTCLIKTL